jgi:DNA primase
LCFDADSAGLRATERAIPLASKQKLSLGIISIPSGKDPDELVRTDVEAWKQTIIQPKEAVLWLMDHYLSVLDIGKASGARKFTDIVLPIVNGLSDEVEKDMYLQRLAEVLRVSPEALRTKTVTFKEPPQKRLEIHPSPIKIDRNQLREQQIQEKFLSLVLVRPTLRALLHHIKPEMMITTNAKELLRLLSEKPDLHIEKDIDQFKNITDYVKIEVLLYEELYKGLDLNELHYEASNLASRIIENYVKSQKILLTQQLASSDNALTRELLQKAKELDQLLYSAREEENGK